jgi:hypothetical protein
MTANRAAAYFAGCALLGAWLASAASTSRDGRRPAPREPEPSPTATLARDVQAQAVRLRDRLAAAPVPRAPHRNPFTFADRAPAPPPPVTRAVETPIDIPAPPPPEPVLALIGVAENQTPKGLVRTAMIINEAEDLMMAAVGESVLGGRYQVVAIGADAVELKDTTTGATRRLGLR